MEIPTVAELTERYEKAFFARVKDKKKVPVDKVHADARATAVAIQGLYKYGEWILKQQTPQTADDVYLKRHAGQSDLTLKSAAKAFGTLTINGNVGGSVSAGKKLSFTDGSQYVVTESMTLTQTSGILSVEAEKAGTAGNRKAGDILTFAETLSDIQSTAMVVSVDGGTEEETNDSLLRRLLFKLQNPAHGGDMEDWIDWALSVEGVTRAWLYPHESGVGTVTLRIMADDDTIDGIPTAGILTRCSNYIETVRPVTAKTFFVVAPEIQTQDFTIRVTPNTEEVRNAVELEIKNLLLKEGEPAGTILLSHIDAAISSATGETDHKLLFPTTDIQAGNNKIIGLGTVTWQAS